MARHYVYFEFASPIAGKEAAFSDLCDQRISDVLTLPGWAAGQRFRNLDASGKSSLLRFVTIYDLEAASTTAAAELLTQAVKAGKGRQNNLADPNTSRSFFLEPLTPYVRKEDVHH